MPEDASKLRVQITLADGRLVEYTANGLEVHAVENGQLHTVYLLDRDRGVVASFRREQYRAVAFEPTIQED